MEAILDFVNSSGFALFAQGDNWKCLVMLLIACGLLYLGIVKKFEPLLLVPIAFGMLITNLPGAEMYHEIFFAGGHIHWDLIGGAPVTAEFLAELAAVDVSDAVLATATVGQSITPGLIDILYLGVKLGIYPCLIFMGVGAMTDFGPLIANPKSLLLGAAAQLGIFMTFVGCRMSGIFSSAQAGSIGIIGGADGPTAIYGATKLAPELLGPIAVAAYSYMALVPIVQPFAIRLVTTKKERRIRMEYTPGTVSKGMRIAFPILTTFLVGLVAPQSVALVGFLMFGNLIRECGVLGTLSDTAQNVLANLITLLLGLTISFSMRAEAFVNVDTLLIMGIGLIAFIFDSIGGVLLAKLLNLFRKKKVNPMIGAAGISAFPMSARVVQKMALEEDPGNVILMHAIGANVSGQIASVIAGGLIIGLVSAYL